MHQEEFVYDEIASPREIMLVSRNVSYDDQNCRPLLRLQLRQYRQPQDGAGTGRGLPRETSSSPSSGPPRCTTKNPPWFITITAFTTPETAGGSTVTPSPNREDGIFMRSSVTALKINSIRLDYKH